VNPIVVGAAFGPSAVGIVALTLRLVTAIGAMREIVRRLSLPGMRRLIGDEAQLRAFAENARDAQIFLVGLPLLAFSFMLPLLERMGHRPILARRHRALSAAGHRSSHRRLLGPADSAR
jgi:hypothetical protein